MLEDLRGDVGGRAAEGGSEGLLADDFSEAKVGEFDGEVFVEEEDVLRLDVAVDNVAFVLDVHISSMI